MVRKYRYRDGGRGIDSLDVQSFKFELFLLPFLLSTRLLENWSLNYLLAYLPNQPILSEAGSPALNCTCFTGALKTKNNCFSQK